MSGIYDAAQSGVGHLTSFIGQTRLLQLTTRKNITMPQV